MVIFFLRLRFTLAYLLFSCHIVCKRSGLPELFANCSEATFSDLAMLFWFSQLQTVVASVLRACGTFILQHRKAGPAKECT